MLGETNDRNSTLQQVAQQIVGINDQRQQSNIAAATSILAGLVLEKQLIQRVLRSEIMKESVIYQDIWEEGKAEGVQEGVKQVAVNLLNSGMAWEEVARVTGLSPQEVQLLLSREGEA